MTSKNEQELIAAYVPALHKGYTDLFDKYPEASIGIFNNDILTRFDYLRKDIRALAPETAVDAITGLGRSVKLLSAKALAEALDTPSLHVIMADDDISRTLVHDSLEHRAQITFSPVFLRWNRNNVDVNQDVTPDREMAIHDLPPHIRQALSTEREGSTNWWRHVSAIIAKDNTIVSLAHNSSTPTEYTSYIEGDPRITTNRGSNIDLSIDIHAESLAISDAARRGIPLEGSDLFVSTFPCPTCAKLIATSGIHTCYFVEGYAMLDGLRVLKSAGIEIVKVNGDMEEDTRSAVIPYEK